eukprot:1076317-Pleurochrysis_carterae.AAC.1
MSEDDGCSRAKGTRHSVVVPLAGAKARTLHGCNLHEAIGDAERGHEENENTRHHLHSIS